MADPYGIITNVLVPNGVTVYQNIIVNVTFLSNIRVNNNISKNGGNIR